MQPKDKGKQVDEKDENEHEKAFCGGFAVRIMALMNFGFVVISIRHGSMVSV